MFVGFSVSNYLSFKTTQTISMAASKVARHKEHILNGNGKKILKTGLIYGANASGKSNLVKAIDFSRDIILNGLDEVDLNKKYFRICGEGYKTPGVFEYRLITYTGKEYSYGIAISYAEKAILSEWLIRIEKNGTETYIFNRDIDENGINFTESEIKIKDTEEKMRWDIYLGDFGADISQPMKKKSILSDIAERSNGRKGVFSEVADVFIWFQSMIILFPTSQYSGLNQMVENEQIRNVFSKILNYFDTGIESVESKMGQMEFDKIFEGIPKEDAEKLKVRITNDIGDDPVMFKVNSQVYSLRKDSEGNIITTKMMDLIRQDEIWFVKRRGDHSSDLYSLNRYKERYDKKIDKEYLLGRYDAIPVFDDEVLEEINV